MKVLLGVTGSVAATLTDKIVAELEKSGHEVKIVPTLNALYFWRLGFWLYVWSLIRSKVFFWIPFNWQKAKVITDFHEWWGWHYRKDMPIMHIALRDWADVILIAPLTADTLAKIDHGFADNLLLSIVRAWNMGKPIILAPAMNTKMFEHPTTMMQLMHLTIEMQEAGYRYHVVEPMEKKLACGDTGLGALAPIQKIVEAVNQTR